MKKIFWNSLIYCIVTGFWTKTNFEVKNKAQRYKMEANEIYDVNSLATVQSAFIRQVLYTCK